MTRRAPGKSPIVLVLGSRNRKKNREMSELIAPPWEPSEWLSRLDIRSALEFPGAPDVVEDADTFAGNARKKAGEMAQALGCWVLADDSGLAVDALGGAPGVFSARYAGEPSDDEANNRKLLSAMQEIAGPNRSAAFHCALALADPLGTIRLETEGLCRGQLTLEPRGPGGFGYDPLFLIREYHQTFGELSPLVKHQLSHRARAFGRLRRDLIRMIVIGQFDADLGGVRGARAD
jgi:XTP/dITP diphosphohydrolase